jgi:hypothetical protein
MSSVKINPKGSLQHNQRSMRASIKSWLPMTLRR